MSLKWQKLHLPDYDGPPLLFNYTPKSDSYQLYITDLTHVWTEHLTRKAILKRADAQNTTIDPSEDPEQFRVLFQKIQEALHGSPGSSVSLNHGTADSLELIVITKLPAPLKPLKWALYLSREPNSSSTRHLLLPLLREAGGLETRERALLDHIKNKDWVIGKIFDKIETMGIDLSTVFPGTSGLRAGRKGTTLDQAGKYIKGVAPFDEKSWVNEVNKLSPDLGLAANIASEISSPALNLESLNPAQDKWWSNLPVSGTTPVTTREEVEEEQEQEPPRDGRETDTDAEKETEDEEFEVRILLHSTRI